MRYYDTLIFEITKQGRVGHNLPKNQFPSVKLDASLLREQKAELPEVSELEVVRHYTNVSLKNFGIESGFYPLGSCTMKYNPKLNDELAGLPGFANVHPLQPNEVSQGFLEIYFDLARYLSELTGMDAYSLNTYAGAHGELAGLMIIKKYHELRNDSKRKLIIVPDSAHGTNPASATVCGFDVIEIKSHPDGTVNIDALKEVLNANVAGLMLTNPNTAGVFEKDIVEISKLVHEAGGLVYYDGANLNALLGVSRPGDMGFDITHLNLHKTFSTPHGGGGPGSGPVGVKAFLKEFLPGPVVEKTTSGFKFHQPETSIGALSAFYGNASVYLRAYVYIRTLGIENLKMIGKLATLNANYIKESLKDYYKLPIEGHAMHEFVFDGLIDQSTGVKTLDIAKRLLDYGMHAPTIYFPLIFSQSMMIEPTEAESKETLDKFIDALKSIAKEAIDDPENLKSAPHNTVVRRLDEAKAARNPIVAYKDIHKFI
ncbi:aminomethyl-transferring glycine dehydrogenase subunit GcvPB [Acholeplasma equirhinis]|uniref:aminomethyl-transferring glycine dehydrogenase subunit GcvPB n=1 Tax=Acholeplasma equirhinis TaxID=555393 RepID=UPI00197AE053|nr:aminomethyl-transferring glycine dehydrogenase subunit GcvPB [Acholeplasma equirhinis]MBN3490628.1 aminomethyl-transferring glycine dehydrogenase subunit GcvPB [Acholeplasma equirhinis]